VNGPASPPKDDPRIRTELLKRIEALHPVTPVDGEKFVAGGRLALRRAIDREAALRAVAELEAVGASAEVEANRPAEEAILALDQFQDVAPEAYRAAALNEELMAQLQPIDADAPPAPVAPAIAAPAAAAPAAAAPALAVDDTKFRPSSEWAQPMELELERPAPPPARLSASSAIAQGDDAAAGDDDAPAAEPIAMDEPWHPVPGRIAQGALRKNPPVRIAIGVVLGLALGWMFAQPYAHKAERHVAELRAQADAERYRPVDEAQARVRDLDRQADEASSSGAIGMALIWVLVGAAAFAGWWRAT
jgi:hypothetical protein